MAFEERDMSGILFKNDRKDKPNQPDYRGTITVADTQYRLSAWIKDGKNGKFLSIAVSEKDGDGGRQSGSRDPF